MTTRVDIKVVLLGMHDVGKTCLVERYLHGVFKANVVATVGAAFGAKIVDVNGQSIALGIWDTAGAERYESMSKMYYRAAKAAIICYDLTNGDSWAKVDFWVKEVSNSESDCDIYIVGTKLDLIKAGKDRGTPLATVKEYTTKIFADVFETSAMTGEGVEVLFSKVAEDYFAKNAKTAAMTKSSRTQTNNNQPPVELSKPRNQPPPDNDSCC